jgi:hypothetical protein
MLERLSIGLRTLHASPTPWPARVGTCPKGGAQEPDDHQHGQADALEVVFLQGRETDAESRYDESPMRDPCILISSAKAVNDLAGGRPRRRLREQFTKGAPPKANPSGYGPGGASRYS